MFHGHAPYAGPKVGIELPFRIISVANDMLRIPNKLKVKLLSCDKTAYCIVDYATGKMTTLMAISWITLRGMTIGAWLEVSGMKVTEPAVNAASTVPAQMA